MATQCPRRRADRDDRGGQPHPRAGRPFQALLAARAADHANRARSSGVDLQYAGRAVRTQEGNLIGHLVRLLAERLFAMSLTDLDMSLTDLDRFKAACVYPG